MKFLIVSAAGLACLTGCTLTPDSAAPSWTDTRLNQSPANAAPIYIERAVLSSEERRDMAVGAARTLEARNRVRVVGAALMAPTLDTADFVVAARARGLPPAQ